MTPTIWAGAIILLVAATAFILFKRRKPKPLDRVADLADGISDATSAAAAHAETAASSADQLSAEIDAQIEGIEADIEGANTLDAEADQLVEAATDAAAETARRLADDLPDGDVPGGEFAKELVP